MNIRMNKRLAVLAGAISLSMVPLTAQAQTGTEPAQLPTAECADHHLDPGHIGWMASQQGGQHIAEMAQLGHGGHNGLGHMASMYGRRSQSGRTGLSG